ncbi:nuclear factor of activated T-cells 5 isoform X3 [Oryzias melastigma]|uniref:nuclear factor of activated T-cells 5 isoform X3 n=1 Tax=Oryzias melastigma TaxID=30732 RepID=UPI000CF7D488|nr:nuclear factor of activated T-cells 5 isoform X3 [Oryzias melastigma]
MFAFKVFSASLDHFCRQTEPEELRVTRTVTEGVRFLQSEGIAMPSDFISLFNGDLDLNSPSTLYSKESVYDLLPRELQLPASTQHSQEVMSQTSGGEADPLPSAPLASDAKSYSLTMDGPRSASSSTISSCGSLNDQNPAHNRNADPEDIRGTRVVPEVIGVEGGSGNCSSAVNGRCNAELGVGRGAASQEAQTHHQMTPSKRRTILNISPPPEDLLDDSRMSCQDDAPLDSELSNSIWMDDSLSNFSVMSTSSYNDNTEVPRKSRKRTPRQRPGPKAAPAVKASMDVFDADSANGPHFVLSQLGPDTKNGSKGSSEDPPTPIQKGGILSMQFPQKCEGKELKILAQPETQHRARYLTEGSRGSVKDRTQQGFPTVKLEGVNEPVVLQIFVGNDSGRVKPHGFYQACRVTGRNTTACKEVNIDGTTVIEVVLDQSTNMTLAIDCVGILKLRNADVEARIGVAGSKKKSTRARLVFRVNIPRSDGSVLTLQAPSSPILCTQPAGLPEILKKSLHTASVRGGEEVFIIGKNFLKDTKVLFHENISDEQSWKAEAEIDMELFHQNHLIVKVPPYQNQAITSSVCVGIYVVTNAGRSHDVQPFTYTPDPDNLAVKNDVPVKTEMPSPVTTCSFDEQIKVKREDFTPMEVTSNLQSSGVFKQSGDLCPPQQNSEMTAGQLNKSIAFSSNLTHSASEPDTSKAAAYTNPEPLSTIQKQDIAPSCAFSLSAESLLPPASQQFLVETRDSLRQDRSVGSSEAVGRLCAEPTSQQQQQQQQLPPLFPQDEVAQLEEAVRQLKAKGYCSLPLQSDNSIAKQQQQQHMQHQQQIQNQQIQQQQIQQHQIQNQQMQQQQMQNQQRQQQQIQQQQIQNQQIQQQQMQQQQIQQQQIQNQQIQQQQIQQQQIQQQQVLENLQQQILQTQIQMQCGMFQDASQGKTADTPQTVVTNQGSLFQSEQQQQQNQSEQQQAALFQQANDLCSMQTGFLQQTPSHSSPSMFHNPTSMAETQDPQGALYQKASQEQVQAALFQSTMTVLQSQEQQPATSGLFLPQTSLPTQLSTNSSPQQQQQLAFLTALQSSSPEQQPVFQTQSPMSAIQPRSPLEQQQASQHQTLPQPAQQSGLFQSISPHSSPSTLSPGQQQQQQQAGLLFCSNGLSPQPPPSNIMFTNQGQMPPLTSSSLEPQKSQNPSLPFSQSSMVTVSQQNGPEPMSLGNPADPQQQVLFQEQQPMQLGGSPNNQQEPPVGLFMPQSNIPSLQGELAAQELAQTAMFASQNGVANLQTTTSSPVQQPGTLFQNAVNPPSQTQQPGLFLFSIQNECDQLMNTPGNTLTDQIIAISQSGQNQRESDARIQSLLSQTLSQPVTVQSSMSASQNMEKIDDLLVSLQESSNNLTRSF